MSRTIQESVFGPPQYNPNGNRTFNQLTSTTYDTCSYENQLRLGSMPMKYYVNQFNSPQADPFIEYSIVGNQKQYNVRNNYERPLPTRLNPIYPTYVFPYDTTAFLGNQAPNREYADTSTNLRFGAEGMRDKKSAVSLSEVDYNRWEPGVSAITVQNAGQFDVLGGKIQQAMGAIGGSYNANVTRDGFFNHEAPNNVLFANSAWPPGGISTRNQLHNAQEINNC